MGGLEASATQARLVQLLPTKPHTRRHKQSADEVVLQYLTRTPTGLSMAVYQHRLPEALVAGARKATRVLQPQLGTSISMGIWVARVKETKESHLGAEDRLLHPRPRFPV